MVKHTYNDIKMVEIILNKDRFLEVVSEIENLEDIKEFRKKVEQTIDSLTTKNDSFYLLNITGNGDTINYQKGIFQ